MNKEWYKWLAETGGGGRCRKTPRRSIIENHVQHKLNQPVKGLFFSLSIRSSNSKMENVVF